MRTILTLSLLVILSSSYGQTDICDKTVIKEELETTNKAWTQFDLELELGNCNVNNGKFELGISHYESALKIALVANKPDKIAITKFFMGSAYYYENSSLRAIDYFNEALKDENYLSPVYQLIAFNSMGVIYLEFEEYEKAITNFNNALLLADKAGEITNESYVYLYNNIGVTFSEMGEFDSSFVYHYKCLNFRLENGDIYGAGQSYNNLGEIYYKEQEYDSAVYYYKKGLEFRKSVENAPYSSIQESELNISKTLVAKKEYHIAEQMMFRLENDYKDYPNLGSELKLSKEQKTLYANTKQYKKAYEYTVKYYELKDEIYGIEKREQLINQNLSYQYASKKRQDSLLNVENEKMMQLERAKEQEIGRHKEHVGRVMLWGLGIALVLTIGIMGLLYRNYRSKQKSSDAVLLQKKEVEKQRDIAQSEKKTADEQRKLAQNQKMKLELVNQEVTDSITYAKRIQNAILPSQTIISEILKDYFIFYQPKAIVAGDFFWVQKIEGKIYFAAADCTGHGVPGALVSIICSNALNRSVDEFGLRQPNEILDKTTDLLIEAFTQSDQEVKDGMDVSLCCLDRKLKTISFAGANNPLYIIRKKLPNQKLPEATIQSNDFYLLETKGDKLSIGWNDKRKPFTSHLIDLVKEDRIYSFTDGYPDQFGGPRGKKYKYKPFKQFLVEIANLTSSEQQTLLKTEFNKWKGDLEQVDDVCVISVKI